MYPYFVGINDRGVTSWSNRKQDAKRFTYIQSLTQRYKLQEQTEIERV